MALSAFDDPARPPVPAEVRRCLGAAASLWTDLVAHVAATCPRIEEAWSFAGARFGWSLRLKKAERVLVHLTPRGGHFLVGIVLGEKAVAEVPGSGISSAARALLDEAPRYAEGRGIRIEIGPDGDLEDVRRLVALKTAAPRRSVARKTTPKEGRAPRSPRGSRA